MTAKEDSRGEKPGLSLALKGLRKAKEVSPAGQLLYPHQKMANEIGLFRVTYIDIV